MVYIRHPFFRSHKRRPRLWAAHCTVPGLIGQQHSTAYFKFLKCPVFLEKISGCLWRRHTLSFVCPTGIHFHEAIGKFQNFPPQRLCSWLLCSLVDIHFYKAILKLRNFRFANIFSTLDSPQFPFQNREILFMKPV
jgi:hypothetical protein